MRTDPDPAGPPLWNSGQMTLRVAGAPDLCVRRSYALIGRTEGVDLRVVDRRVSARHVYLHLDARGLFAIDLATRTGTRFESAPTGAAAAWLGPGHALEIAGCRIEILEARITDRNLAVPPAAGRLLTDAADTPLPRLALVPLPAAREPWTLDSELVFLGRSPACGVPIRGSSAARVHAAIFRTAGAAYLVNLAGWGVWLDGTPVRTAAPLPPGVTLTVGASRFEVRLGPAPTPTMPVGAGVPATAPVRTSASVPAPAPAPASALVTELVLPAGLPPLPAELAEAGAQGALLSWMMGVVQATQAELVRRQEDFQRELVRAVRGLHEDNQAALQQHQDRVESIHHELAALREEIRQRFATPTPATAAPPRPKGPPLKLPTPTAPPSEPEAATAWLLNRVNQLDEANRSTWRDLLGRLGTPPRSGT